MKEEIKAFVEHTIYIYIADISGETYEKMA